MRARRLLHAASPEVLDMREAQRTAARPLPRPLRTNTNGEIMNEHGVKEAYMDNIGNGWRIECLCGWASTPNLRMQDTGEEFDEHLYNVAGDDMRGL
jgi:hypothetical protein